MTQDQLGLAARLGTLTSAGWLVAAGALIIVAAVVFTLARRTGKANAAAEAAFREISEHPLEIATMRERASLSAAGNIWILLILLNWLFAAFLWSTSMSTLQEAVSVLIWIGGTVTFGLFATLSIERRYTIYRIGTRES